MIATAFGTSGWQPDGRHDASEQYLVMRSPTALRQSLDIAPLWLFADFFQRPPAIIDCYDSNGRRIQSGSSISARYTGLGIDRME